MIGHFEPGVVRFEDALLVRAPFGEQRDDMDGLRTELLQFFLQGNHGDTGVDDIFDDEDVLVFQDGQIAQADDFELGGRLIVDVAAYANEFETHRKTAIVAKAREEIVRRSKPSRVNEPIFVLNLGHEIGEESIATFEHAHADWQRDS